MMSMLNFPKKVLSTDSDLHSGQTLYLTRPQTQDTDAGSDSKQGCLFNKAQKGKAGRGYPLRIKTMAVKH